MVSRHTISGLLSVILVCGVAHGDEDRETEDRGRSISNVNSSIELKDGERAGDLDTVNGSIRVGNGVTIASAKTVNGSVTVGDDCHAQSLQTVNGGVKVGRHSVVNSDIIAVNGRIELAEGAFVHGDARNVNSEINLDAQAHVGGKVVTRTGDITLRDGAIIDRGILIEDDSWWSGIFGSLFNFARHTPVITIGPGAEVRGEMIFEREVELRVHSTAKISAVKGATVHRY